MSEVTNPGARPEPPRTGREPPSPLGSAQGRLTLRVRLVGLLGAPLAWTVHLLGSYLLVAMFCSAGWGGARLAVTALTVVTALAAVASGVLALRRWRTVQHAASWEHALNEAGGPDGLLLMVGVMSAALFTLLIVLNGLSPFVVPECAP